jgi:probable phosphoglycerate mutase
MMLPYMNDHLPSNLILIRHGESTFNVARAEAKAAGATYSRPIKTKDADVELTDEGRRQSAVTAVHLPLSIHAFITSPYKRALATAFIAQAAYRAKYGYSYDYPHLLEDERLREKEYGIWNTYSQDEMKVQHGYENQRRKDEGRFYYRPIGGENIPDVKLRVHQMLGDICYRFGGRRVVLVSHALTILAIRSVLENWSPEEFVSKDVKNDVRNCCVISYYKSDRELVFESDRVYYEKELNNANGVL